MACRVQLRQSRRLAVSTTEISIRHLELIRLKDADDDEVLLVRLYGSAGATSCYVCGAGQAVLSRCNLAQETIKQPCGVSVRNS